MVLVNESLCRETWGFFKISQKHPLTSVFNKIVFFNAITATTVTNALFIGILEW